MEEYFDGKREELKGFIPQGCQRVLEIGCGNGGFRSNFPVNTEYWGVEPNSEITKVTKLNLDKVLHGRFEDIKDDIPDNYFDLIVCNDVIEHMSDHDWFFENIKNKLTSDGRLLISIPNVRFIYNLYDLIFRKDWQYKDQGILDRTHLRFFTRKSLLRCIRDHNYEILRFEGINNLNPKGVKNLAKKIIIFTGNKDILSLQFCAVIRKM